MSNTLNVAVKERPSCLGIERRIPMSRKLADSSGRGLSLLFAVIEESSVLIIFSLRCSTKALFGFRFGMPQVSSRVGASRQN